MDRINHNFVKQFQRKIKKFDVLRIFGEICFDESVCRVRTNSIFISCQFWKLGTGEGGGIIQRGKWDSEIFEHSIR